MNKERSDSEKSKDSVIVFDGKEPNRAAKWFELSQATERFAEYHCGNPGVEIWLGVSPELTEENVADAAEDTLGFIRVYVELIYHFRLTIYKPVPPQSTTSGAAVYQVPAMLVTIQSIAWANAKRSLHRMKQRSERRLAPTARVDSVVGKRIRFRKGR